MSQQPDIELLLGWDEPDLMESFIKHVANGGLAQYKHILQFGKKAGEPLFNHAINGVFLAYQLGDVVHLSEDEKRVLFSAFTIHDLNKSVVSDKQSFNKLASLKTVQAELEIVGIPGFFPEYQSFLEDITLLIRSHSGHYHTDGEWLIPAHNPYHLSRGRLELLRGLIKALDEIEMSDSLTEREHKQGFLVFLNTQTEKQYKLVYHQTGEQRGLLTNVIHNQAKDYLANRFDLIPLLFYPNGVVYLAEEDQEMAFEESDLSKIGMNVSKTAAKMTRGSFAKFIKSGNQGIKVDEQCLDLKVPFEDILGVVYDQIMKKVVGKRFKIEEIEKGCQETLMASSNDEKFKNMRSLIQKYQARPHLCPTSQDEMGVSELLRTYYIFLNSHFSKEVLNAWQYLYRWLVIPDETSKIYDLFDPLYQRAYFVTHDLNLTIEELMHRILEDGNNFVADSPKNSSEETVGVYEALRNYTARVLTFSWATLRLSDFAASLHQYVQNNHEQCCYCGSEFDTGSWMSNQAPENVAVQLFSNRLSGGSPREPKRNVCQVCRSQFILEKLNIPAAKGSKTFYLHFYPYTFFTAPFLISLRAAIRNMLEQDTSVIFPRTDDAIKEIIDASGRKISLHFYTRNKQDKPYVNGLPLPLNYSEVVGNTLTFALNCPGDNDSEQFLFALQNALLLGRYFGCKVLLSTSAVPILEKSDFDNFYVDNIPLGFEGLLPTNNFNMEQLNTLWDDIKNSHQLTGILFVYDAKSKDKSTENKMRLDVIRSLTSDARLELYYLTDRIIEKRVAKEQTKEKKTWLSIRLSKESLPFVQKLLKGENRMKPLQLLAETAWRDRIIGRSLERNALLKPFDMMLDGLEAKSEAFEIDTLKAQLAEDIFRHLEVIALEEYKPGRTKRDKVKAYIDIFFDEILGGVYRSNVQKLLADTKPLRSAYLFYVREQIPTKEKEK
jgi:CRISPR-associated protein Csc3